jgi:proteasome accessory factor C
VSRPSSLERLSRLLALVPWVIAQDGPLVREVCRRFAMSERELVADLDLLFMCGVYPYTPDALIEVDIHDGRVWVRFADWFRRPLRLTAPEALALVAAGRAMLGAPAGAGGEALSGGGGKALASALSKLELLLGSGGEEGLDVQLGEASAEVLATLQQAARERRRVLVDYYSFGRDESGDRVVQPWRLFSAEGHWYMYAWCEKAQDKRLFRVDRTRSAALAEGHFEVPGSTGPVPTYEARPEDPVVELELGPGAAWVAERYPVESRAVRPDGRALVRLRASSTAWLERLLLRAGPEARVVSGAEGVAEAAARRVLSLYGAVTCER